MLEFSLTVFQRRFDPLKAFLHPIIPDIISELLWKKRASFLEEAEGFFEVKHGEDTVEGIPGVLMALVATAVRFFNSFGNVTVFSQVAGPCSHL